MKVAAARFGMLRTRVHLLIAAFMLLSGTYGPSQAQTPLTQTFALAWAKNPEPNIDYYRLHIGTTSGQYTTHVRVNSTNCITPALPIGPVFYFSVTAVNTAGLESDYSAEISSAAAVAPQITAGLAGKNLQLSIQALPGQTCTIETSQNLRDWLLLTNRVADLQGRVQWSPASSSSPLAFFRARAQ
jgi:hypothetical protein